MNTHRATAGSLDNRPSLEAGEGKGNTADKLILTLERWPESSKFARLVQELEECETPPLEQPSFQEEAVAALSVCLHRGSTLGVLLEPTRQFGINEIGSGPFSDTEVERIYNEGTAALASWVEIKRTNPERYFKLLAAALSHSDVLVADKVRASADNPLPAFCHPEIAELLLRELSVKKIESARKEISESPTHRLAEVIMNYCWLDVVGALRRNRSKGVGRPIQPRRLEQSEERRLLYRIAGELTRAFIAINSLLNENSARTWEEKILPFSLVAGLTPEQLAIA